MLIVLLTAVLIMLFGYARFVLRLFDTAGRKQEVAASEHDTPPEQVLLLDGVAQRGKHIMLYASRQQTNAAPLVGFADGVLEYYAGQLGVETPREPVHVYLLDAQADYQRADALYNMRTTPHNFGFARHGNVYLYVRSRPGQPITEDSKTAFELAHELCHAIHQKLYPCYDRQPSWLLEGGASAWAEQAIIHAHSSNAGRLLAANAPFILLRQELAEKRTLSLVELFTTSKGDFGSSNDSQRFVTYAKCFALFRMLDDSAPANAERRTLFRGYLKQINTLDPSVTAQETNRRFGLIFGGPKLVTLQNEYVRYIQTAEPCPWQMVWTDARLQEDGALVVEARSDETAMVLHERAGASSLRLHVCVEVAAVGRRQADVVFGKSAANGFYALYFQPGCVGLVRFKDDWTTLATCRISPLLFAPGQHTLEADIRPNRVEARLDGKSICIFQAADRPFHAGQWGVGCYDSHITFRNVSAQPIVADENTTFAAHSTTFLPVHTTR